MKISRVIDLLKAERACVKRNAVGCDRNCAECDLVQEDHELIEMYDFLISMMELQDITADHPCASQASHPELSG